MTNCGYDLALIEETKGWTKECGKKFILEKDDIIYVPNGVSSLKLALGWVSKADLDSSILMLDVNGNQVDKVFFNNKKSKDESVLHGGDDRTGEGDGDDETIQMFLDKVDP